MKLLKNIYGVGTIAGEVLRLGKYKKAIDKARKSGDVKKEQEEILRTTVYWSDKVVKDLNFTINVINKENLPKKGPVVYICNHQSYADILAFLNTVRNHQVGFIAKDSLTKMPVFGAWVARIRGLFIHRGDARASLLTINEGVDLLNQGFSLVIFPEGTRSRSSEMASFKPGSFKLATKAKVTLVPVTVNGGYHVFEENSSVTKGCHMDFMVHKPIETKDMTRQELAQLPEEVEKIVRDGLKELI